MGELNSLHIIIFRAMQSGDSLAAQIRNRGGRVHQLPVQKIEALAYDNVVIKDQIEHIERYQKLIFVSRNAASLALDWLDQCSRVVSALQQCFAIGPASAALLENRQIAIEFPAERWNSEGLLALPALANIEGQRILIFRGLGGRPTLGEELLKLGARVEYCELYQRCREDQFKYQIIALLTNGQSCVLVAHSGEILDALVAVVGAQYRDVIKACPVVVPGIRLRKYARQRGFQQVITASTAAAKDIEHALSGWYTEMSKGKLIVD